MDAHTLLARLRQADDPRIAELSNLVVAQLLATPINAFLDPGTFVSLVTELASREHLAHQLGRHGRHGARRVIERLAQSGERLGDAVPKPSRDAIVSMLTSPAGPRLGWLAGTLDRSLLRELLTPVFYEVILAFVAKLRSVLGLAGDEAERPEPSRVGGLFGRLGKDVGLGTGRRLLEVGRSVAGSLGLDVEERIQALARDFSGGASEAFRSALVSRLRSDDGRRILRALLEHGLEHLMNTPLAAIHTDLERVDGQSLLEILADLWSYNLRRDLGQRILTEEATAWFTLEGSRPLADWLSDAGILEPVRSLAQQRTHDQLRRLFASDPFAAWLTSLLRDPG